MNTPPTQNQSSKPPPIPGRFAFEPMPGEHHHRSSSRHCSNIRAESFTRLQNNWRAALLTWLLVTRAARHDGVYGLVVGSFSGGAQLWIAPAKIAIGTIFSILICLPSLYIFTCLSGIDAQLANCYGCVICGVGLARLLFIGFAPVAWIFSQSTDSVAFMAALHHFCGRSGLFLVCVCLKQWAICWAVPHETI